jgi:cold shock CspA family protein
MRAGVVAEFDAEKGLGTIATEDGATYPFHVIEIVDGSRTIDVGQRVRFQPLPKFGVYQAGQVHKVGDERA